TKKDINVLANSSISYSLDKSSNLSPRYGLLYKDPLLSINTYGRKYDLMENSCNQLTNIFTKFLKGSRMNYIFFIKLDSYDVYIPIGGM
ncbi:hypothetical protein CR513_42610, partial [Mucuna pruriens]